MIMEERNTETIRIGDKTYCVYCGKEAMSIGIYEDYNRYEYNYCNCEGAKLEIKMQKIKETLEQIKNKNIELFNQYKYENEILELKHKYNIA